MGHFLMSSGAMAMANHTPGADKCSWHSLKINLLWIVELLQCLSAGSPFSPSKLAWLLNRDWNSPQQIDVLLCALKLFYGSLYDLLLPANQQLKCQFVLSFPQTYINSDPLLKQQTRHLREISSHCCGTLKAVIHCSLISFSGETSVWKGFEIKNCASCQKGRKFLFHPHPVPSCWSWVCLTDAFPPENLPASCE